MDRHIARLGAAAALLGTLLLAVGTILHPMQADPADATAAFAEYAEDSLWVASHLAQFLGIVGLGAALVALAMIIDRGRASAWARIGAFGAAASIATAAALQATDGVALKVTVDRWAAATGDARLYAFEAAFAVRQIEIGLASLLSVLFGVTILVFGGALIFSRLFGSWLGWLALIGGSATFASGIAQAYTGFAPTAMMMSMSASLVLLVWAVALAVVMWRMAPELRETEDVPSRPLRSTA